MPTLFARRYMRPLRAVGRTEKTAGAVIALLTAAVIAVFAYQVATDRDYLFEVSDQVGTPAAVPEHGAEDENSRGTPGEPASVFPDVGLDGWCSPRRTERFTADELYVKIDGRADAYMKFGVVGLTFGRYCHESDARRTVDVYWYDMGTPANALGMYRSEEPPDVASVSLGQAGYQVGGSVFFCQGSSYMQVMPSGFGDADARAALNIAERLADRIKEK